MSVIEDLTEEEIYLWCILQDESGIDQAEFLWFDSSAVDTDEIFRAWSFQWVWWHDRDMQQIDQSARAVGKSKSITLRGFCFPFIHPNREMVVTAPELVHLEPITRLIETQLMNVRLTREMLPRSRSSITHRPFQIDFINGSHIIGRIPQRDGKGVNGIHPIWLELDEASLYPGPGWVELIETLNRAQAGAIWRAHGVTRGLRDYFYQFTQADSGWTVHRIPAMARPTWTDEERADKIEAYGSRDSPDYRRNILGLHGDSSNPLIVLHVLMAACDLDDESEYNSRLYKYIRFNGESLRDVGGDVEMFLSEIPESHQKMEGRWWLGMDCGFTNHPSEILAFLERKDKKSGETYLQLMTRIHMERIRHQDQAKTVIWLTRFYNAAAFAMDSTGLGLPLFQDIQDRALDIAERIKGYNFASKILVDFDKTVVVDEYKGDPVKDAGIERNVLEYASDSLRGLFDSGRVKMPNDRELIKEFQGQTWQSAKTGMDQYGRRRLYSMGNFHALDAAKMAILGWKQHGIEELMANVQQADVLDVFVY